MMLMCSFDSLGNLNGNTDRFTHTKLTLLLDIFLKCNSLNKFHYNVIYSVFFSGIIYAHNIGVNKTCGRLRLRTEFGYKSLIFTKFRLKHLYRNISV